MKRPAATFTLFLVAVLAAAQSPKPNILLFLCDDLGYRETGARAEDGFDRVYFERRLG